MTYRPPAVPVDIKDRSIEERQYIEDNAGKQRVTCVVCGSIYYRKRHPTVPVCSIQCLQDRRVK